MLADADEHDAGIASAVNNAIARTAGLLATAAVGAVLATSYADRLDSELAGRTLSPAAQAAGRRGPRPRAQPRRPGRAAGRRTARSSPRRSQDAGVATFHLAALIGAGMLAPARGCSAACCCATRRRPTAARRCPGGQLVGAPEEVARRPAARAHAAA